MIEETEYHKLADEWLNRISDALEGADETAALDIEYQSGILTITLPSDKTFIVSKHTPTRQLWLSSPISGGLHFSFHNSEWSLNDGRVLDAVLAEELTKLASLSVSF